MDKKKKVRKIIDLPAELLPKIIEAAARQERSVKNYLETLIKSQINESVRK